jgi:hypothetical protein
MSNKYKLGDITQAQMTNDWSRVPRAAAIGAFLVTGGATTSLAVATAIVGGGWITAAAIYAVGYIATTLVTSFLTKALSPKSTSRGSSPKNASDSGGLLVNARGAANPAQVVYGQVRKGGTITYVEATGTNNKILHQIVVLAAHEIEEIGDIYFDDQVVTMSDENVTSAPFSGHVKIYKHLGDQTSATDTFANSTESLDTTLHSESGISVDSEFIGKGIAYLYCRFEYDQDAFVNGLPTVTAVVKGKKVVSTINGVAQTAAYSSNSAWIIRDFLTSSYGLNDDQIDYATFEAAADVCDAIEYADEPAVQNKFKYTIDGVVDLDQPIGDVLEDMMTSCAGSLFWGGGKWKLIVGEWVEPIKTLTLDDFRSPINLKTKASTRDNFNKVTGTFIDRDKDWVTADYPPVSGSAGGFLSEDNNIESTLDFSLPFTTYNITAQRLAKQALFRGREQMTLNADFSLDALDLEVGDVVNLRNERYGWGTGDEKAFEVLGWRLNANADTGALHVNLDLKETSEASYGFSEIDEQTIISNNTTLLRYYEVPTVSVTLNTEYRVVNENVVNVLVINITSNQMERVDSVNVKYKKSTDTSYKSIAQSVLLDEGNDAGRFEVVGIEVPNTSDAVSTITYDVVVTPINSFGYRGASVESSIDVGPDVTPPQCNEWYTGELTHQTSGGGIYFKWPAVSDLDLSHYRLYHNPSTSANFSDGNTEVMVQKIARPATSVSIPATAGKFFLSAVDKTGNNSTSNVEIGTVTRLLSDTVLNSELPPLDFSVTWPEATSFSGTKSNVTVSSGEIFLTTVTVGSDTYYTTQGTYQFYHDGDFTDGTVEGYFDVGGVRTIRTSFDVTTSRRHINSVGGEVTWDDIPNNWDTWPDNFEDWTDETTHFGDTVVTIQVRAATTTGGLSSATWVAAGGEVVGRYVQFRARLDTTNALASPEITALSATVEY